MLQTILDIAKRNNFKIFTRPYELNIWGLRSRKTETNKFNDEKHVFYKDDKNKWQYYVVPQTTDPSTYYLQNPIFQGTAILKEGQYVDCWQIGLHKGLKPALVQVRPVTVYRDYNKDSVLDFGQSTQTGNFGINHHAPSSDTGEIGKDSAGCQVTEKIIDHLNLMVLAEKHKLLYGNSFTYTLVDFRERRKTVIKRIAIGTSVVALFGSLYMLWKSEN